MNRRRFVALMAASAMGAFVSGCGRGGEAGPSGTPTGHSRSTSRLSYILRQNSVDGIPVLPPPEFLWTPPISIFHKADGTYDGVLDLTRLAIAGAESPTPAYYVDKKRGDDTHDGSANSPLRTLRQAFLNIQENGESSAVVYVSAALYYRNEGWDGLSPDANISVICEPGTILSTAEQPSRLQWEPAGQDTYVATCSRVSPCYGAVDLSVTDEHGVPKTLAPKTSVTEVPNQPGSFYTDGASVWVHTHDGRLPDDQLLVLLNVINGMMRPIDKTYFVRGAQFYGGRRGAFDVRATTASHAVFSECDFAFCSILDGLRSIGSGVVISHQCRAFNNWNDGFNYHDIEGLGGRAIELNCQAWGNGLLQNSSTHNGSTAHDAVKIVRVITQAWHNQGPNIVDTDGCQSWCVGCSSFYSVAQPGQQRANYYFAGEAWLEGCSASDSDYDIVAGDALTVIKVRNQPSSYVASPSTDLLPY